jgi:hypothetical protein
MPGGRKLYNVECERCARRIYDRLLGQRIARQAARYHLTHEPHNGGQVSIVDDSTGAATIFKIPVHILTREVR